MKRIVLIALSGFILSSCSDNKKQETALLNEVIKLHDKVMVDDNTIMKNKMQLKSIAASSPVQGIKDSAAIYAKTLDNADDAMMAWMNKFNPDFTGKSHDEIMAYLNKQKVQILKINAQLDSTIAVSNEYISKTKGK